MQIYAWTLPKKKYGVIIFNMVGEPIVDRQHCANTIKDAIAIARADMKEYPFSCASVYTRGPKAVRHINCAGEIIKL